MLKSSLKLSFLVLAASSLNAGRAPVEINFSNAWKKKGKVLDIDKKMSKEALSPFFRNVAKDFVKLTPSLSVDVIKLWAESEEKVAFTSDRARANLEKSHKLLARYALVLSLYNSFEKLFFAKEDKNDSKKAFKAEFKKKFFASDFLYELTLVQFDEWNTTKSKWELKKFDEFIKHGDYGRLTNAFVKGEGKLAQNLLNFGIKNVGGVLKNVSALLAAYNKCQLLQEPFSKSSAWLGAAKLEDPSKDYIILAQKLFSILVKSLKFDGGLDKKALAKKITKEVLTNLIIEEFELASIFKFSVKKHAHLTADNKYANFVFKNMDFVIKRAAGIYVDMKFEELWDDLFAKEEVKEVLDSVCENQVLQNETTPEVVAQAVAPEAVFVSSNTEQHDAVVINALDEEAGVEQIVAAVEAALAQASEGEKDSSSGDVEFSEAEIAS